MNKGENQGEMDRKRIYIHGGVSCTAFVPHMYFLTLSGSSLCSVGVRHRFEYVRDKPTLLCLGSHFIESGACVRRRVR